MTRARSLVLLTAILCACALAGPARAQREAYSYLSWVGPDVSLVSNGEEDTAARVNTPVGPGDRISTGRDSRAEAILADGTVVRFDARTEARFDRLARTWQSQDDRTLLALQSGAVAVETRRDTDEERATRVDTDDATVVLSVRAFVRVDAGRRGTEVYVLSGSAEVLGRSGRETLRAGESAFLNGSGPIDVAESGAPRDRFTQFLDERRSRRGGESLQYLERARVADGVGDDAWGDDGYDAAALDDSGSWVYVSGQERWCWRPRVGVDWRPYADGYWRWTPGGMTWVSYESWGWLPYHFGSWLMDASFGWCWSPGWSYSPAWVYWNYTPGWVGWCPIGYYGGYEGWHDRTWNGGRWEWSRYAHLTGRVDVSRIDQRGWNYAATTRMGTRFERGDVVRGDRVGFRRGEVGVIATAPLRVERGAGVPLRSAIQDAVRRVPTETVAARGADPALTSILRRERSLPAGAEETLRRSMVTSGRDTAYRPLPPSQLATGRVETIRRDDLLRETTRGSGSQPGAARADAWRAAGRGEARVERPDSVGSGARTEPNGDRFRRDDSGWRAPRGDEARRGEGARGADRPRESTAPRDSARREDSGWRSAPRGADTPRAVEPPRRTDPPRGDIPRREDSGWRSAPRGADAPRAVEPPRRTDPPRGDVPRREDSGWRAPQPRQPAPSRSYEMPQVPARRYEASREYDSPRQAAPSRVYDTPRPAPQRYEAPRSAPAPRYEPPRAAPRFEAPRAAPAPRYDAPRSAPAAPRYEAPRSAPAAPPSDRDNRRH